MPSNLTVIARLIRSDRDTIFRELTQFIQEPITPAGRAAALALLEEARATVHLIKTILSREVLGQVPPLTPLPCAHTFDVPILPVRPLPAGTLVC